MTNKFKMRTMTDPGSLPSHGVQCGDGFFPAELNNSSAHC